MNGETESTTTESEAVALHPACSALPIPTALYPCKICCDEYSCPADDLYWSSRAKAWICTNCWDDDEEVHGDRGIRLDAEIKRQNMSTLTKEQWIEEVYQLICKAQGQPSNATEEKNLRGWAAALAEDDPPGFPCRHVSGFSEGMTPQEAFDEEMSYA